ncbi:MAG: 50S ribosomal protein L11 methyltransferase, partial [Gammaproteobacteria bacterium]|nr:50S ribosomal protein L11 methyltransferase [Gammaproteobacteria bacterium]
MAWQKLVLEVSSDDSHRLEQSAMEMGALSVSLEDAGDEPLLEPGPGETPMWSRVRLIALFPENSDRAAVSSALTIPGIEAEWEQLEDRDWERVWLDDAEPVCFGNRLWICPTNQPSPDTQYAVRLDPGLAFGTGRHATTALCLEWLAHAEVRDRTVLDYGCGSGI